MLLHLFFFFLKSARCFEDTAGKPTFAILRISFGKSQREFPISLLQLLCPEPSNWSLNNELLKLDNNVMFFLKLCYWEVKVSDPWDTHRSFSNSSPSSPALWDNLWLCLGFLARLGLGLCDGTWLLRGGHPGPGREGCGFDSLVIGLGA